MHNALMMIPMGIDKNLLSKVLFHSKYWYSLAHFQENSKEKMSGFLQFCKLSFVWGAV